MRRLDPRRSVAEHRLQAVSTGDSAAVLQLAGRRPVAGADRRAAVNRPRRCMHPEEGAGLAPRKVQLEAWRSASPPRFGPALQIGWCSLMVWWVCLGTVLGRRLSAGARELQW